MSQRPAKHVLKWEKVRSFFPGILQVLVQNDHKHCSFARPNPGVADRGRTHATQTQRATRKQKQNNKKTNKNNRCATWYVDASPIMFSPSVNFGSGSAT